VTSNPDFAILTQPTGDSTLLSGYLKFSMLTRQLLCGNLSEQLSELQAGMPALPGVIFAAVEVN